MSERVTLVDYLKAYALYPLPQHALSRVMRAATRITAPAIKNAHIAWFARRFAVDMSTAREPNLRAYGDFNSFFTRALRDGTRPVVSGPGEIACPVDGLVSQAGRIEDGKIVQAKGNGFTVQDLLGGDAERARPFKRGSFATLYLSPRDYHRVHMPCQGELREMVHVPGRLFSVNAVSTRAIPRLFARNERLAALFESDVGPMAVVMVGAMFVGSIETVWAGEISPPRGRHIRQWHYPQPGTPPIQLGRGAELGRFNMGSTVIVLFGPGVRLAPAVQPTRPVRMGQLLAQAAAPGGPDRLKR